MLAAAPFAPEPHLREELKMLAAGTLSRPIDAFGLFWHSWLLVLLALKLARMARTRTSRWAPVVPRGFARPQGPTSAES